MAYFEDLTDCVSYFGKGRVLGPLMAVGWLDINHSYPRGSVSPEFLEKLGQLLEGTWEPAGFAGGHHCEFCFSEGRTFQSTANLHLPSPKGFFVAPSMILHYIQTHDYRPPRSFQEAVMICPKMFSEGFFNEVEKLGYRVPPAERAQWRAVHEASLARRHLQKGS